MRADRLLSILFLLQGNGRMTARSLAARLEVSERTIDRDMEALSMSGVPVWAERGRGGGWQLTDEYRTDLTGLTESELRSLALTTAPAVLGDLGLTDAADRAVMKLLAGLPEARRRQVETARRYLHIDPRGWRRTDDAAPELAALDEALRTDRRIAMTYERADGSVVERRTNPLGLVANGSVWYLVAASEGEPRTYRASRIRAVELLDEPIERPAGFDLPEFWGAVAGRVPWPACRDTWLRSGCRPRASTGSRPAGGGTCRSSRPETPKRTAGRRAGSKPMRSRSPRAWCSGSAPRPG